MAAPSKIDTPNCETFNETGQCINCKNGFKLDGMSCYEACDSKQQCEQAYYCDLHTISCKPCSSGCLFCSNQTYCAICEAKKTPNIYGKCENDCTSMPISLGQTCKNGKIAECDDQMTQQCFCLGAINCKSCNLTQTKCDTCLPAYKKSGANCSECALGYAEFGSVCIPIQVPVDKCNSVSNTCIAGTFCPATDINIVDCKKCDESIINGQGCNCKNDIQITNCLACQNGECTKCINGYFLKNNRCEVCPLGCYQCDSNAVCTEVFKLSSEEIAGIVIGVLVVVGGIAGGLSYYMVRKGKVARVQKNQSSAEQ